MCIRVASAGGQAILLAGCQNSLFYNLEITNGYTSGILVRDFINAANPNIRVRSNNLVFRNCLVTRCGENGIKVESGVDLVFQAIQVTEIARGTLPNISPSGAALNVAPKLFPGIEQPLEARGSPGRYRGRGTTHATAMTGRARDQELTR